MSTAAPPRERRRRGARAELHAFGIGIQTEVPLPLAPGGASGATGRRTRLAVCSSRELDRAWRPRSVERVLERCRRDGTLVMAVDHDPELGYRVAAPRNGRHLVAPDGLSIRSALPHRPPWSWQRLLFAQVLPLAATLQGLELLHASAVELDGRGVAFVAPSGTGKTSIAAHVVAAGGTLLTDDVLALEVDGTRLLAHPGVPRLAIDPTELDRMSGDGRSRLGACLGRADGKDVVSVELGVRPVALERLYFLERRAAGRVRIDRAEPDPVRLLANSFNVYVRTPGRIVNQLAIAGRLAEAVSLFTVRIPQGGAASEVARRIVDHARRT